MKNINEVESDYLINVNTERAYTKLDTYTRWNSMTSEQRTGWYEANLEHFDFTREDAKKGLERMIRHLVSIDGYEGMGESGIKEITEDHVNKFLDILNDITRGPAFSAFEEYGEMIDPAVDVVNEEPILSVV